MIIAIDGPVGTGKSTVAKKAAQILGFIYFDTGAMYRCFTYGVLKHKLDPKNQKALEQYLETFSFDIRMERGEKRYFIEGEDISEEIRKEEVTRLVSEIAALPFVREKLVKIQQEWAEGVDAVFEGRDIGTVVFPNAKLKIYLNATAEERARRRLEEWKVKFPDQAQHYTLESMIEEITHRDHQDMTRKTSPLKKADDAVEIDTTNLSIDQVVEKIVSLAKK